MKLVVIMPGGFHPFHAGHFALYQAAKEHFPNAEVYVAATNDQSNRPFDFKSKQLLAQLAGVPAARFVQVKAPFAPQEILTGLDPDATQLIFVKSDKNSRSGSQPEGPFPAEPDPITGELPLIQRGPRRGQPVSNYLQYWNADQTLAPMSKHAYIAYLPTRAFGQGMTSGRDIRGFWQSQDQSDQSQLAKRRLVQILYPKIANSESAQDRVIQIFDRYMSSKPTTESLRVPPVTAIPRFNNSLPQQRPKKPPEPKNPNTAATVVMTRRPRTENQGWAATLESVPDYLDEKVSL